YNVAGAVRIEGRLAVATLSRALDAVVRRHEALRTTFVPPPPGEENGVQQQVVEPPFHLALPVIDLAGLPEPRQVDHRQRQAGRLAGAGARHPSRLADRAAPADHRLLRAHLLCLAAERHLLLLSVHHIVSDGRSHDIFLHDLAAFYTGAPLPE